jgi:hypothetical protein
MKGGLLHGNPSFMLFICLVKRQGLRMRSGVRWLMLLFLLTCGWCGWIFFRPYDPKADVQAPWRLMMASVKRDHSYYWVRCKLKVVSAEPLPQSILLISKNRRIRSADCIRMKDDIDHISFWVEESDLQGQCELELNGKRYLLKKDGAFQLDQGAEKAFRQTDWKS